MAKVWSTLTDGFSNEHQLAVVFINGVGWVGDETPMIQLEAWYGYHVDRSTNEHPDALDKATKDETMALCSQYSIDPTDKPKWTIIGELRSAIGAVVPIPTAFQYSYNLAKWLEDHELN